MMIIVMKTVMHIFWEEVKIPNQQTKHNRPLGGNTRFKALVLDYWGDERIVYKRREV